MSSVRMARLMSQYRNYMEERILIDERIDRIWLSWIRRVVVLFANVGLTILAMVECDVNVGSFCWR
jgi:hypothetical protein